MSQAELDGAYASLGTLEAELAEADAALEAAIAAKKAAQMTLIEAKEAARTASKLRDPIFEEWQRAAWIVRNADPEYPAPPMGAGAPQIDSVRN